MNFRSMAAFAGVVGLGFLSACMPPKADFSADRPGGEGGAIDRTSRLDTIFAESCLRFGGMLLQPAGKRSVCHRVRRIFTDHRDREKSWTGEAFPLLSADDPGTPRSVDTGFYVYQGDRLAFEAEGYWGSLVDTEDSSECRPHSYINGDPVVPGESPDDGEGIGYSGILMGSDGTETFELGFEQDQIIRNDGKLYLGIDAPESGTRCAEILITRFEIHHCEDSTGRTVLCPSPAINVRPER